MFLYNSNEKLNDFYCHKREMDSFNVDFQDK